MVGLSEDVEHRTALLGIAIQDAMQVVGREAIGEGLRALPVLDVQEGVVGKGETNDAWFPSKLSSEPCSTSRRCSSPPVRR
jgi:hypothetical protein